MLRKAYEDLVNQLVKDSLELSNGKAHDYAAEDVLANFKRIAKIAKEYKISFEAPYEYALFMTLMKLDRLQNLLKQNKQPKNESLKDTIQDAFNYLMLMFACLEDK
jgi:superoxide dismutase